MNPKKNKTTSWYEINNKADDTEIIIYDEIANTKWWENDPVVTAKSFLTELQAVTTKTITLRINSPGGNVFAGQAIYSALKSHPATITVYIDGIAASIASVIAMAGDRIVMPENAMMMIHNPSSYAVGDAEEMRRMADMLDKAKKTIVATYRRTGKSDDELNQLMDAETWMTGLDAVNNGFADEMMPEVALVANWDLSDYQNVPPIINQHTTRNSDVNAEEVTDIVQQAIAPFAQEMSALKTQLTQTTDELKNLKQFNAEEQKRRTDLENLFALFTNEPANYQTHYAKLQAEALTKNWTVDETRAKLVQLRAGFSYALPQSPIANPTNFETQGSENQADTWESLIAKKEQEGMSKADATRFIVKNHPDIHAAYLKQQEGR